MGQVSAASSVLINAAPEAVLAAVANYQTVRPKILSSQYSDYEVLQGGQGQGTVARWKLQATKSRVRDVQAVVMFKAERPGEVRVSLRSKGRVDVRAVAAQHGGGGHTNAAGFTAEGAYPDVRARIVAEATRAIEDAEGAI